MGGCEGPLCGGARGDVSRVGDPSQRARCSWQRGCGAICPKASRELHGWSGLITDQYHFLPYREEEFVGGKRLLRPTCDVQICRGEFDWTAKALIDTGSPHTIFDRAAADA